MGSLRWESEQIFVAICFREIVVRGSQKATSYFLFEVGLLLLLHSCCVLISYTRHVREVAVLKNFKSSQLRLFVMGNGCCFQVEQVLNM